MSVRTSVRPSTKSFFDFDEIGYPGSTRWEMHNGMTLTRIQGQGHRDPKIAKSPKFKVYLLRQNSLNLKTDGRLLHYRTGIFMQTVSNALRHGSHSFTCKLHHAYLYSPAAEHHRPLAGTYFTVPRRVEGWVDLGGWLHTEIKCRPGVEPGWSPIPVLTGLSID